MQFYHYIQVPVVNMRRTPDPGAEVVSQAFYSEAVQLLEEQGEWARIRTVVDQYQGWIKKMAVHQRNTPFLADRTKPIVSVRRLAVHLYHTADTIYGPMLTLPFESRMELVEALEGDGGRWLKVALPDGSQGYIQRGDVSFNPPVLTWHQMCELSFSFLGLPYTWGGRSSFGYDCSGYVQMLYRQMGVSLPRDSKDQCFAHYPRRSNSMSSPGRSGLFWFPG